MEKAVKLFLYAFCILLCAELLFLASIPRTRANPGDMVSFTCGSTGTIDSISIQGFCVSGVIDVTFGDSGKAVFNSNNEQIGYVSTLKVDGTLYCIWR